MAASTGYSSEALGCDYMDWQLFDHCVRRPRCDSFINLMPESKADLPDVRYTQIEGDMAPGEAVLLELSYPGSDSETYTTPYEDALQLPALRVRTKKKKQPMLSTAMLPAPVQSKQVGTLSTEERQQKIKRYLEKRQRRTWTKKISYDCRKRVADNRLRVKGRFVTKLQAVSSLGLETVQRLLDCRETIKQE